MITNIIAVQTNVTNACNLISVHNPVAFIVDCEYDETAPTELLCELQDEFLTVLDTFKCIPIDGGGTKQRFIFIADAIIRGYMSTYQDFVSIEANIYYCEGFTREFNITFGGEGANYTINFVALHASKQFGEDINLVDIRNNTANNTYYTGANMPVYVYVYADADDVISLNNNDELWADFDETPFLDQNKFLKSR